MIKTSKPTNNEMDNNLPVSKYLRSFLRKIMSTKTIKVLLFIFVLTFFNIGAKFPARSEQTDATKAFEIGKTDLTAYPLMVRERLHRELVIEVKKYITNVAPTSKIDAEILVTLCRKYEMDITFVLAQGLLESHFGTRGKAAGNPAKKISPTNSVFNVGSWDGGKILYKYKNVNESIEPFILLIKNDYMGKRTLAQLLHDGGYKNMEGHRYASSPTYEQGLRSTISSITMETSIKTYQDIICMSDADIMAYFGPTTDTPINQSTLTASLK